MSADRLIISFPSAWHGDCLTAAAQGLGLPWVFASTLDTDAHWRALSLVNNDACYTTIVTTSQIIGAGGDFSRDSKKKGVDGGAANVCMPQLCPGCRACNAPYYVMRALGDCGIEGARECGFREALALLSPHDQRRFAHALVAADVLLQLRYCVRPRVEDAHTSFFDALVKSWRERIIDQLREGSAFDALSLCRSFDEEIVRLVPLGVDSLPRVGIAGNAEALFCPAMNCDMAHVIEEEGCKVVMPYLASLSSYALHAQGLDGPLLDEIDFLLSRLSDGSFLVPPAVTYAQVKQAGLRFVPESLYQGMGWSLAGWISILADCGVTNVVYASMFGCLPGHVVGSGVLRRLRGYKAGMNIASIEFDPGTSEVNQLNRMKLIAAMARGDAGA